MNQNFFADYQPYIFIAIGLIVVIFSILRKSSKNRLKQNGILVDGIIFEKGITSNNSNSFKKDKITIRFVTLTGEWITGVVKQDFGIYYPGQYKKGDTVKVYYDKENPSEFYIDPKQSELFGRVVFGVLGLFFFLIGLYKLFR